MSFYNLLIYYRHVWHFTSNCLGELYSSNFLGRDCHDKVVWVTGHLVWLVKMCSPPAFWLRCFRSLRALIDLLLCIYKKEKEIMWCLLTITASPSTNLSASGWPQLISGRSCFLRDIRDSRHKSHYCRSYCPSLSQTAALMWCSEDWLMSFSVEYQL